MDKSFLSKMVLFDILGAHRIYAKKEILTQRKKRPNWALAMKLGGNTEYTCREITTNSNPQRIVLLPKGIDYTWISHGGECLMIEFDCNIEFDQIVGFSIRDNKKFVELFERIEHNRATSEAFSEIRNLEILYRIFIMLFETEKKYVPSKKPEMLRPSVDYINGHFADPGINLSQIAGVSGMSEVYFRKTFTELYGSSPMKYVHMVRMNKAKEILKSDYNSIEAVARSVGYNSVYHFSKMFKKYFGVSPSEYGKS